MSGALGGWLPGALCCPGTGAVIILTGRHDDDSIEASDQKGPTMGYGYTMYRVDRDRLVQSMTDNQISGRALAVLSGCSRTTTCDLWAGRRIRVIEPIAVGIAAALEMDLNELFTVEDRVAWQRGTLASPA